MIKNLSEKPIAELQKEQAEKLGKRRSAGKMYQHKRGYDAIHLL